MQLAEWTERFADLGVAVGGMVYDGPAVIAAFHAEHRLNYPLLRDVDARTVNAWGIRNPDYPEGNRAYGIPYPGIVWIGADGTVKGKWALPGYRDRPSLPAVYAEVAAALAGPGE